MIVSSSYFGFAFLQSDVNTLFCLNLECAEDTMVKRVLARGAAGSGRADDNELSIKKRLKTFYIETRPILDEFRNAGRLKTIDGEDEVEQVWEQVKACFSDFAEPGDLSPV